MVYCIVQKIFLTLLILREITRQSISNILNNTFPKKIFECDKSALRISIFFFIILSHRIFFWMKKRLQTYLIIQATLMMKLYTETMNVSETLFYYLKMLKKLFPSLIQSFIWYMSILYLETLGGLLCPTKKNYFLKFFLHVVIDVNRIFYVPKLEFFSDFIHKRGFCIIIC